MSWSGLFGCFVLAFDALDDTRAFLAAGTVGAKAQHKGFYLRGQGREHQKLLPSLGVGLAFRDGFFDECLISKKKESLGQGIHRNSCDVYERQELGSGGAFDIR